MIKYISFDPGAKRTGVVEWKETGEVNKWMVFNPDQLYTYLDGIPDEVIMFIIEEYRFDRHRPQSSKAETIQIIGSIKYAAKRKNAGVVEIPRNLKSIASKWSGMPMGKGHLPDWKSAYLIGYYWLRDNNIIKSRLLKDIQNERKQEQ